MENLSNEKHLLENGWKIEKKEDKYYLEIFALENSIFRENKRVEVPVDVFEDVKKGEKRIEVLFKKHKLYELLIEWKEPEKNKPFQNSSTLYYGKGFLVENVEDQYFLNYQLDRHGGGDKKVEISKELYLKVRKDKMKLDEIREILNTN